jgi:hypothetical protein
VPGQALERRGGVVAARRPEQPRSAEDGTSRLRQFGVKPGRAVGKRARLALQPRSVGEAAAPIAQDRSARGEAAAFLAAAVAAGLAWADHQVARRPP